jgi:pimeloyl-ACP methyl ester carboxylesterase
VSRWEAQKRPHRLRRFTPDDYVGAGAQELGPADVAHMAGGKPCLLFVHGTFSTSHAAFGDLPLQVMTDLFKRYEGRVFAFDHPTLASAPIDNVKWLMSLMSQMPATGITADIVCHSRGGLVARLLAERPQGFGLEASPLNVRRLVMAGVPSAGTPLADPDHMVDMIDRLTTVLTLAPSGLTVETLEALVIVLKVLGRGLLKGLDGLIAMRPDNEFLQRLNSGGTADGDYYAIASNYEPNDRGLKALLSGAVDGVVDFVFEQVGNDLVVPTDGVHGKNGHARFPVPQDKLLLLGREEAATHVQLFSQPAVGAKLQEWLG